MPISSFSIFWIPGGCLHIHSFITVARWIAYLFILHCGLVECPSIYFSTTPGPGLDPIYLFKIPSRCIMSEQNFVKLRKGRPLIDHLFIYSITMTWWIAHLCIFYCDLLVCSFICFYWLPVLRLFIYYFTAARPALISISMFPFRWSREVTHLFV